MKTLLSAFAAGFLVTGCLIATGQSAGGSSALPYDFPVTGGLVAYLDADALELEGDQVRRMNDRSGSGNHAWRVDDRPALPSIAAGVTPSGKDAVSFDGRGGYVELAANPADFDGRARTTLAVFRAGILDGGTTAGRVTNTAHSGIDTAQPVEDQPNGRTRTSALWAETGGRLAVQNRNPSGGSITARLPDGTLETGKFYIGVNLWREDGETVAILVGEENGRVQASATGGTAEPFGHLNTRIGAGSDFGNPAIPDHFFAGEVAALAVFDRELTPGELEQVESFLHQVYLGAGPGPEGAGALPVTDGLILHLSASEVVTNEKGFVTSWTDLSGRGNHAAGYVWDPDGPPPAPTYILRGTPSGRGVVRFNGENQYLEIAPNPVDFDGRGRTTLVAFRPFVLDDRRVINSAFTTLDPEDPELETIFRVHNMFPNASGSLRVQNRNRINGARTIGTANGSVTADVFHLGISRWNEDGTALVAVRNESGGRFSASGTGADAIPEGHLFTRIGADSEFRAPDPQDFFAGDVAAVVVYDRPLSDAELELVENYLHQRYVSPGDTPMQRFAEWISEYNLPAHLSRLHADASGNNVSNLAKYAFGMDPTSASLEGLPQGEVISTERSNDFVLAWDTFGVGTVRRLHATRVPVQVKTATLEMGGGVLEQSLANGFSGRGWGGIGSDFASAMEDGYWIEFTVASSDGGLLDLSRIEANLRTAGRGPTTAQWGYRIGPGSFVPIGSPFPLNLGHLNDGHFYPPVDLSGIPDLQGVSAATFRLAGWGASGEIDQGRTLAIGRLPGENLRVYGSVSGGAVVENHLTLTVNRSADATGASIVIEGSDDLLRWTSHPAIVTTWEESDTLLRARLTDPIRQGDRGFLRARARLNDSLSYVLPPDLPNKGFLYVDHQAENRSGHGGQSITEAANGDILAFYSNVSPTVRNGHGVAGWAEYRISEDGGSTWSEPHILDYSMDIWEGDEFGSALIEEVMTAPNGTIVAIARRHTDLTGYSWDSTTPVFLRSYDHGRTWSEPKELDPLAEEWQLSRDEGSMTHGDTMYILFHDRFTPSGVPSFFRLYVSIDNGESFSQRSVLPFDQSQWYGTIGALPNGDIIVYTYNNEDDGTVLQYVTSDDQGVTWSEVQTTPFAKRIRNPQMSARVGGLYFMHGRSGSFGPDPRHLVLYSSKDGIHWDDGIFLNKGATDDLDSYSTNEVIGKYDPNVPESLLIQSSIAYASDGRRVNLHHWNVRLNQ